jgi:putative membrane protein
MNTQITSGASFGTTLFVEGGAKMNWLGTIVRLVVSALVLMFVGFIVPGFSVVNFWSALIAAIVIALLGWAMEALFGERISPYGRGIAGFLSTAIVLCVSQLFVPGMRVTILGALIAALVVGIIDMFIPTSVKRGAAEE